MGGVITPSSSQNQEKVSLQLLRSLWATKLIREVAVSILLKHILQTLYHSLTLVMILWATLRQTLFKASNSKGSGVLYYHMTTSIKLGRFYSYCIHLDSQTANKQTNKSKTKNKKSKTKHKDIDRRRRHFSKVNILGRVWWHMLSLLWMFLIYSN